MRVQHLGIEGVRARIAAIQSKLDRLNPPAPFAAQLSEAKTQWPPPGAGLGIGLGPMQPFDIVPTNQGVGSLGMQTMADETADEVGIDKGLFRALINAESAWNPNSLSPKGAKGLTQLMPETARGLGVLDPFDPLQNLRGGAKYLKGMIDRFGGDVSLALAAYNAGPNAVKKYNGIPPYAETQNYVKKIMAEMGR